MLCLLLIFSGSYETFGVRDKKNNPGQLVLLGGEIGLPYDLANTLNNPLGKALGTFSALSIAVLFYGSILWMPFIVFSSNRKKRDTESWYDLPFQFSIEDGFRLFNEKDISCRKRAVYYIIHNTE